LRIEKIENLDAFTSLRKLNLLDNKINSITGLENLKVLEELCLEKNKITQI
jgi:Leucine-rich repeat (LRR) protein